MSINVIEFLNAEREKLRQLKYNKKRLGVEELTVENHGDVVQNESGVVDCGEKENIPANILIPESPNNQNAPLVEKLDLSFIANEESIASDQQALSSNPSDVYSSRRAMLRYGEYSPNNPQLRVNAAPYLGFGEYEQRKKILKQRQAAYKEHLNNQNERIKNSSNKLKLSPGLHKSVQTDIQNINNQLIQYTNTANKDLSPTTIEARNSVMHNNRSPVLHRLDQRITAAHNNLLKSEMDKPRGILTNRRTDASRERMLSDMKHSYVPPANLLDGFSYTDRAEDMERERIKREIYQNELRLQIEEKRRLAQMREEQDRREQELENRRLEQQLLRMQEEQLRDEQRRTHREQIRRNSDDFAVRKQELQSRPYRKHTDSESSVSNLRSTTVASKLSHYSPPVSRRHPFSLNIPSSSLFADPATRYNPSRYDLFLRKNTLNRMDSLNVPSDHYNSLNSYSRLNSFSRYDSLSRIDSLKQQEALNRLESLSINDSLSRIQRRHSATQQDLSLIRRSPKLQRRSSSSRFEDSLPIPVLKAHSPVARELKNSIAVNSTRHGSDALRKLEDKWQIPAVQKNIVNYGDHNNGQTRNILTQLGAIRMQLQQEQLRMDETLRKRGNSQSKAVEFH